MSDLVIEGFAGPGGWSTGLRMAGFTGTAVGIEWDDAACRTAHAAGHLRVRADVAAFALDHLAGKVDGTILSPPCQAWSNAGDQLGKVDQPLVFERIAFFARGETPPEREWADERSMLTAEPMRWAHALRPRWIALEQVPPVLPLWQYTAELLRAMGYRTWCGILSAEQYGVPQTRRRAILIARRDGLPVGPPEPTHQQYRAGRALLEEPDLFGDPLPPPVSMAEALGWAGDGGVVRTGNNSMVTGRTGSRRGDGDVQAYERDLNVPAPTLDTNVGGKWRVALRNGNQANACERRACEPAGTLFFGQRTNAVDWVMRSNYGTGGDPADRGERQLHEPAATVTSKAGRNKWELRAGERGNSTARRGDDPAPTVLCSRPGNLLWINNRPDTTVCGDARIAPPGHRDREGGERQFGEETVRVTVQEAAILQSFPGDYPWTGTRSQQFRMVGDAVPPLLAAAILRPLIQPAIAQGSAA